jgi:hypothetical protein
MVSMTGKIKSDICICGNKCGFKLANNEKRSSALGHTWKLVCNQGMIYREPAPKGTTKLKRKFDGEELYQEGIGKITVKQSRRVESRGREGLKMSRHTANGRLMEAADCCKFAFNICCSKEDGFYYLSKHGSGRSHHRHPKNDNIVSSTSTMDEETRRVINNCARVINTAP